MGRIKLLCFLLPFALQACRQADENLPAQRQEARAQLAVSLDGFYTANISTPMGSYQRPVMLKGGAIDCIQWSNSSCSPFAGEVDAKGNISGTLQNGVVAKLEVLDPIP